MKIKLLMKKLLFVLVMLLMTTMVTAQKISYQAVVRDSHNRLVVNTNVTVVVTITHGAGTYMESLNGTTNANGLMSLEIGGASGFDAIDWRHAQIKTLVLLPGNETVEDVVQVTAVPIALYANHAADVSPSAPTITAIYSDMAALGTRITGDSMALHQALTDTAAVLRAMMVDAANDGRIVILKNGTAVDSFTVNQANRQEINMEVPTRVGELLNDAGYLTSDSAVIVRMRDSIWDMQQQIIRDSLLLQVHLDSTSAHIQTVLNQLEQHSDIIDSIVLDMQNQHGQLDTILDHLADQHNHIDTILDHLADQHNHIDTILDHLADQHGHIDTILMSLETHSDHIDTILMNLGVHSNLIDTVLSQVIVNTHDIQVALDSVEAVVAVLRALNGMVVNGDSIILDNLIDTISMILVRFEAYKEALALKHYLDSAYLKNLIDINLQAIIDSAEQVRNSIYDSVLTIKQNGVVLGTFSANQNRNQVIDIPTPDGQVNADWNAGSGVAQILNKPTKVSAFDNDADYLTSDSAVIVNLRNDVNALDTNVSNIAHNLDSTKHNIRNEIGGVNTRVTNLATSVDTAKAHIRSEIPTVYDNTITIMQGDNLLGSFTANQSTDVTIAIPRGAERAQADWNETNIDSASFIRNKPTKVSAFDNDAGYLTSDSAVIVNLRNDVNALDTNVSNIAHDLDSTKHNIRNEIAGVSADVTDIANNLDSTKHNIRNEIAGVSAEISNVRSEIPTVYDKTIKIVQGDSVLGSFTANQSTDVTIAIPRRAEQVQANWNETNTDSASFIRNKPTKVSVFDNDAGYLTSDSAVIVNLRNDVNALDTEVSDVAHNLDSTKLNIRNEIAGVSAEISNVRSEIPTVYDKMVKIVQGDSVLGTFTANQSTDVTIAIPRRAEQVQANWNETNTDSASFIRNKPTKVSAFINDAGYLTSDSAVIVRMRDSIGNMQQQILRDSARIDTVLVKVHDNENAIRHTLDTLEAIVGTLTSLNGAMLNGDSVLLDHLIDTMVMVLQRFEVYKDSLAQKHYLDSAYLKRLIDINLQAIKDSANHVRNAIHNGALTIEYATLSTTTPPSSVTFTANQLQDVSVTIPIPAAQVNADWNATSGVAEILHKPDLSGFLTADSSLIVMMRDSIQKVNAHVSVDSSVLAIKIRTDSTVLAHRMDTLLKHVCDSVDNCVNVKINESLKAYTTSDKIDTLLGAYTTSDQIDTLLKTRHYLTADSSLIVMMRDSIQKVNAHVLADSLILAGMIRTDSTALARRMDTLLTHVCDSVENCVTGMIDEKLKDYTTSDKIDTLLKAYTTSDKIDTLLGAYTTSDQIDTLLKTRHYLTADSSLIVMIRDSIQKVNAHVSADSLILAGKIRTDSTALAHRMDTLLKHVCDSVDNCVNVKINESLKAYTTSDKIDTLLGAYTTSDKIDTLLGAYTTSDKIDTLLGAYTTSDKIDTLLGAYTTSDQIDTLLKTRHYLTADSSLIVIMRDSIQKVNAHVSADSIVLAVKIRTDSTVLAHRMDTLLKHVCDSVDNCVNVKINESLKAYTTSDKIDTLLKAYTTSDKIDTLLGAYTTSDKIDTLLGAYTTSDKIDTLLKTRHYLTADSSLIVMMRDSIQKVNAHVSADSLILAGMIRTDSTALAHRMDTLLKHVCDSVDNCVNVKINESLKAYTTSDKIDTLLKTRHYLTADSSLIVMMRDSIQKVNAHVSADSLVLADRIHSDSVVLAKHISDSTRMVFDTLHEYYYTQSQIDTAKANIRNSIYDSVLTIKQNGEVLGTFSANQKTNQVINITTSDAQVQADWEVTDVNSKAYIQHKPNLATVATSGDYDDLVHKPNLDIYAKKDTIHDGQLHVITYGATKLDTTKLFTANQSKNDTLDLSRYALLDTLTSFYATTRALSDSLDSLRKDIRNIDNTLMPKERSKKFIMEQDQQTAEYEFMLPSEPHSAYLVKIYINGVLVGDSDTNDEESARVLTLDSANKKKVTYHPKANENYSLREGDKVVIYWFE
jgi:hypothetical protein